MLDVGIRVFDPGLPEEDESALEDKAVFPQVRKSEARFIAFPPQERSESTGHWGAVRLVPDAKGTADVVVSGEIMRSTGLAMSIHMRAVDSRGRVWRDRNYKEKAERVDYSDDDLITLDPYHEVYGEIANDLLAAYNKLDADDIRDIRDISRLSFAADLAPTIYDGYLQINKKGRVKIPPASRHRRSDDAAHRHDSRS